MTSKKLPATITNLAHVGRKGNSLPGVGDVRDRANIKYLFLSDETDTFTGVGIHDL